MSDTLDIPFRLRVVRARILPSARAVGKDGYPREVHITISRQSLRVIRIISARRGVPRAKTMGPKWLVKLYLERKLKEHLSGLLAKEAGKEAA